MEDKANHSVPALAIQMDMGYGIPGIEYFCNRSDHEECREDLQRAFKRGGRIVPGTFWHSKHNKEK